MRGGIAAAFLLTSVAVAFEFQPNCYGWPNTNRDWSQATAGNSLPRLLHAQAPAFNLRTLDQTSSVSLKELLATGPVVLQFADYS